MKLSKHDWQGLIIFCSIFICGFVVGWALSGESVYAHLWWAAFGILWYAYIYLALMRRKP